MDEFVKVARVDEVLPGRGKTVEVDGRVIALLNSDGKFYALDNFCPHKGGPLADGFVVGGLVACPWHRWTFEVGTGRCTVNPAASVDCFEVKVEGEDIFIKA